MMLTSKNTKMNDFELDMSLEFLAQKNYGGKYRNVAQNKMVTDINNIWISLNFCFKHCFRCNKTLQANEAAETKSGSIRTCPLASS